MPRIDRLLLIALACMAPTALAFECYHAEVDARSVAHLDGTARLYFLAPSQSGEVGQMKISGPQVHARSAVQWRRTQPIQYKFDAVPGQFVRGAVEGGGTTLVSRQGPFALQALGRRTVIVVEAGPAVTYRIYALGDRECAAVFPPAERFVDDDADLD